MHIDVATTGTGGVGFLLTVRFENRVGSDYLRCADARCGPQDRRFLAGLRQ